jgi:asparagine synthase (glutamine-hydrolysing)
MCDMMAHRGPDDEGFHFDDDVALGMRRLSIIDLASGHQPMYNEDRSIVTVFNGEIYNYVELKNQYLKGHSFSTSSDTEVLVHLYEEMGIESLQLLNGMFAFALWDTRTKTLFLARDRLGIKPLYFYQLSGTFVFGSEIAPILLHNVSREVDRSAICDFLGLMYIPAPKTMFKHIRKLQAGCYLKYQDGHSEVHRYWTLQPSVNSELTEREITEHLDSLFRDSIRLQLRSDVPIGTFLSGGLDSSAVVAYESQVSNHVVETFSVGFEGALTNELPVARKVASHYQTNHHEFNISGKDLIAFLPKLIRRLEDPLADSASLPTYLLSEFAAQFVKVVLNGTGGDELFGGYDKYLTHADNARIVKSLKILPNKVINALPDGRTPLGTLKRVARSVKSHADFYYYRSVRFHADLKRKVLASYSDQDDTTRDILNSFFDVADVNWDREHKNIYMLADIQTYLQDDLLLLLDKMTMSKSLEGRVPFLDHRIVEFCQMIPARLKISGSEKKYIMKQWLKGSLPTHLLSRKKVGFGAPLSNWYINDLLPYARDILLDKSSRERGLFNIRYLQRVLDKTHRWELDPQQLFGVLTLELWFKIFIDGQQGVD